MGHGCGHGGCQGRHWVTPVDGKEEICRCRCVCVCVCVCVWRRGEILEGVS